MRKNKGDGVSTGAERASNFELLRIVSMILVVVSHYFVHGFSNMTNDFTFCNVTINALKVGEIGVVSFVLISGYFMVDKKFDVLKLLRYSSQLWFYGVAILAFAVVMGFEYQKYFVKSLIPFYSLNWFAKAYLLLYLLAPLFNKIIHKLTQKRFWYGLLVFGFFWTILPIIDLYEHGNMRISVFYVYFLGAYIRLYGDSFCKSLKKLMAIGFFSYGTIVLSVVLFYHLGSQYPMFVGRENSLLALNSIFVIICGGVNFLVFRQSKIAYSGMVNMIAKTVFGIYLIHDNPLINGWLWHDVLHVREFYDSTWMVPYSFVCTAIIFIGCGLIEYMRKKYVEDPIFNRYGNYIVIAYSSLHLKENSLTKKSRYNKG
ncbi:acyltransferase family protein [Phascolarctobacterium sp.]|uniref:acyltransferase family protein n=1 Tax=Phascolarctobacterium sp. TaxID=2049039 RepID=UPI003867DB43